VGLAALTCMWPHTSERRHRALPLPMGAPLNVVPTCTCTCIPALQRAQGRGEGAEGGEVGSGVCVCQEGVGGGWVGVGVGWELGREELGSRAPLEVASSFARLSQGPSPPGAEGGQPLEELRRVTGNLFQSFFQMLILDALSSHAGFVGNTRALNTLVLPALSLSLPCSRRCYLLPATS